MRQHLDISLRVNGDFWFNPTNLAYLSDEFKEEDVLQMLVTVPADSQMVVCHEVKSEDTFSLQTMRDHSESSDTKTAIAKLRVLKNTQGILYPRMTHNGKCYVNIICFDDSGWFELWRVGIISQAGKFYFVKARVYRARCYANKAGLCCPVLEDRGDWSMLKEFLSGLFADCKLAPANPVESPQEYNYDLPENLARVAWFNPFAGVGCLELPEGVMARIYWDRIANARGCKVLEPGEYVVYEQLGKPQDKTNFSWEVTEPALRLRRRPDTKEMKKRIAQLRDLPQKPAKLTVPSAKNQAMTKMADIFAAL